MPASAGGSPWPGSVGGPPCAARLLEAVLGGGDGSACTGEPGFCRGGTTEAALGSGTYAVGWFDPRAGGPLREGSLAAIEGPGRVGIGRPPGEPKRDWAVLIRLTDGDGSGVPGVEARPRRPERGAGAEGRAGKGVVTGFTLINAETDRAVPGFDPIGEGATIDLSRLPTRKLSVRANTSAPDVGPVRFGLDGRDRRVERTAPYSLTGDREGDYAAWTPPPGRHTLTATAGGRTATLTFTVVDE